jgi:serine phosphatase RsbU (regulator of sigma subunit)
MVAAKEGSLPTVVIVDDEEMVTQTLCSLLELEDGYRAVGYQSAVEALDHVNQRPVDLIISDFLMPGMNGLEFLGEVRKTCPEIPLILLTGYADKENAIRAINEVGLFQYLEKPWDNEQLKLVIRNALTNKSLKEVLQEKVDELDRTLRQQSQLYQRDDMMRQELRTARQLQQKFLPQLLPKTDGFVFEALYRPAIEVGGDFYDVLPLDDGRWAVLMADITGHGIQAALSMALLKFAFSSFSDSQATPTDILTGMNAVLYKGLPSEVFVAAMVVTFSPATRRCSIVNGGLPRPCLIQRKTQRMRQVGCDGLLLGVADDDVYQPGEECFVDLERRDCLIVYTDGLSEATNSKGELFEKEALAQEMSQVNLKSCCEILTHLADAAEQFRQSHDYKDDITLFGIETQ